MQNRAQGPFIGICIGDHAQIGWMRTVHRRFAVRWQQSRALQVVQVVITCIDELSQVARKAARLSRWRWALSG